MIYLLLSILCSSAIFILFRSFDKFKVNTFTAIVINYFIAALTGFISVGSSFQLSEIVNSSWIFNSILLGVIFISLFNMMAMASQKLGASVASVANKMALVIPVVFAIFYYGDTASFLKIIGVLLALLGVYFSTMKPKAVKGKVDWKLLGLPAIIFFGSGFIDTFIKYNQEFHLDKATNESSLFSSMIFLTAFAIGVSVIIIDKSKRSFSKNTLIGGLLLGVINYGSIYFLIETFNNSNFESSVVFPINNMGVVLLTTISSFLIFQERFSIINKIGIAVSVIAILLISFSI